MIHAVHEKFVKPKDYTGEVVSLITFGGKKENFRLANIFVDTPFVKGTVKACVLENIPEEFMYYDLLIGNGNTLGDPQSLDPTPQTIFDWESCHPNSTTMSLVRRSR